MGDARIETSMYSTRPAYRNIAFARILVTMESVSDWHRTLADAGATIDASGVVTGFGDPAGERRAADESAIVVPLSACGLIRVTGPDAPDFLNSQLTSDVAVVSPHRAQYTGYCTPKGRLLATMLLFMRDEGWWLLLPACLATDIAQRLRKFVLRAKVKLEVASSEMAMFGVAGLQAQAAMKDTLGVVSAREFEVTQVNTLSVIALPGNRYLVACPADQAGPTWLELAARMRPAGWNAWQLQTIRAGVAAVTPVTQEAFIPQMVALDTYDGVSFSKGCYPGQEIVARTRYLGDLKRHLYYGQSSQPLAAGNAIVEDGTNANVGMVTDAAENAAGDWEFLAVIQREAVNSGKSLHCAGGAAVNALVRTGAAAGGNQ